MNLGLDSFHGDVESPNSMSSENVADMIASWNRAVGKPGAPRGSHGRLALLRWTRKWHDWQRVSRSSG